MIQRAARLPFLMLAGALALAACQQAGDQSSNAVTPPGGAPGPGNVAASSEYDIVRAMLDLAGTNRDDLVVDLGSGDGRIPITAAREKGSRGLGVELDSDLVRQSTKNATDAGVADRVKFRREVGSSRVDLQACKLEYSIVSPK